MNTRIPVFYTEAQVHDACAYSKSPLKPSLLARKIINDESFAIRSGMIGPATADRLALTHDAAHVRALINGDKADGFGNSSSKDNKAIRTTVGNFLTAAEVAAGQPAEHPGVVWSLTSGFHHAKHASCGGFCTFDALTLAAFELQKFRGMKTLIVDEDAHDGDGCKDVISKMKMSSYCEYMQSDYTHTDNDLERFENQLLNMLRIYQPDIIFYQAGADNWLGDPLGGNLTMQELYMRDVIVLQLAKDFKVPVVVNLAGGYAKQFDDTLQIHMNTGEAMKEVFLMVDSHPVFPSHEPFDISEFV